jgi:diguanylate cyclase (GGDEF)-like protein
VKPLAEREAAVLADEKAILSREEGASQREEGASLREEGASLREEGASLREEGASLREKALELHGGAAVLAGKKAILNREEGAALREEGVTLREEGATLREEGASLREEGAGVREKALDTRRGAAQDQAALNERREAHLREANENLVIATVQAQTMTDAAELATAQMAHMAEHDFLTGLPNRALLTDRLTQAIALAKRHKKKVALLFMDLDRFKHVNDSLGHAVGDHLLQSVTKRLQAGIRHSDTVSRQGGDEFVVLLAEIEELRDATRSAEKLIKAVAKPHLVGGHRLHVTQSIGISIYPDNGKDVDTVLRNADIAMYHAKRNGRNNYQVYTAGMNARAIELQSIEQALYHALEKRELVLHYQPKVNLETGTVTGAEVLLRWTRSDFHLDYPTQFVNIAENCGLILPIGKWVLSEACHQTQRWLREGLDIGQIAVNVSALELRDAGFFAGVQGILTESGLDPRRLELELTESGLMQDTQQTTETLQALRGLGVRIALDDFGTGYSSLGYLQRFPVDSLKIDQSFVQGINGAAGEAIVSAVVAVGTSLKLRVVAEGIETRQQLAFLISKGCTEGQGYYLGRPATAEDFAASLAGKRH